MTIVKKDPMVARETAYYLENITKVKSAEEMVDDTRLLNYAAKAYGLEDMSYAKAFMLKVLEEGPDGFADKLADSRYTAFAKAFNFAAYGGTATTFTTSPARHRRSL